ncbi:MAG: hypothetical protein Q3962_06870 [Corynebacterium sp.]|nr:hypothetical protein [Corynebacterium sp.]
MSKSKLIAGFMAATMLGSVLVAPQAQAATMNGGPSLIGGKCSVIIPYKESNAISAAQDFYDAQAQLNLIRQRFNDPAVHDKIVAWANSMSQAMTTFRASHNASQDVLVSNPLYAQETEILRILGVDYPRAHVTDWALRIDPDGYAEGNALFGWGAYPMDNATSVTAKNGSPDPRLDARNGAVEIADYWNTLAAACGTISAGLMARTADIPLAPNVARWGEGGYNDWRGLNLIRDLFNLVGINNARLNERIGSLDAWAVGYENNMRAGATYTVTPPVAVPAIVDVARTLGINSGLLGLLGVGGIGALIYFLLHRNKHEETTTQSTSESTTQTTTEAAAS